jgi:hypothetical protein
MPLALPKISYLHHRLLGERTPSEFAGEIAISGDQTGSQAVENSTLTLGQKNGSDEINRELTLGMVQHITIN